MSRCWCDGCQSPARWVVVARPTCDAHLTETLRAGLLYTQDVAVTVWTIAGWKADKARRTT